ncbi:cytochrome P450 [Polyporus arcularius HHB13444]|uniref:Cytochrome P450 n=1 Tax=Polyporus arcularius HHB13444 TaxID=1314778 RepID=A0A5C3PBN5_9APHY|nr:cytochrome P450 [Polyporus arcularius HHB13444]
MATFEQELFSHLGLGIAVQRLYFHRLSRFPGPRLAAATWWYMTYYEVWLNGGLVEHLEVLHANYGPVVRIGPNQLHFSAIEAYNDIYLHGHRFTKDPKFYGPLHQDDSLLCLIDLREVKTRREILGPLFSRRAILKLEHVVQSKVNALLNELYKYAETGRPANMRRALRSTAIELIYAYCFATNEPFISAPGFSHKFVVESEMTFKVFHWVVHFAWVYPLLILSTHVAAWVRPSDNEARIMDSYFRLRSKIDELVAHPETVEKEEHETVFHHLLRPHPEKGQPEVPSKKVLWEEAVDLIAAGGETVSTVATFGLFYVLNDPAVHKRLVLELKSAWPDPEAKMDYEALEKLPYLTAVIKESLRLAHGVVTPAPRVVSPRDRSIAGFDVPAGTIVAMGAMFVHFNPDVFPRPREFVPERWLESKGGLEKHLVAFSKGPRACIGMNLGWCELYLLFGYLFRKLDMELYDTTAEDMKYRCKFTAVFEGKMLHCKVKVREG